MLLFLYLTLSDDEQHFVDKFYEENHRDFYNIAMSISHSHEIAEEAIQETFLKIVKNIERILQLPCQERVPYCVVIMKNTSYDIFARKQKELECEDVDIFNEPEEPRFMLQLEDNVLLQNIIEKLTEDEQYLLTLKWVYGYQYNEIGKILGCNERAASKRGSRLMIKIRSFLKKEEVHNV